MISVEDTASILQLVKTLHFNIFDAVRKCLFQNDIHTNSQAGEQGAGDVSYHIDVASETMIDDFFQTNPVEGGVVIISEGIGKKVYPEGLPEREARYRLLIDPIDGTREIMYDKRSAWVITAVAPNRGGGTSLADVFLSVQTELPVKKQNLSSFMVAAKGGGAWEEIWDIERRNMITAARPLKPSGRADILHGFVVFTNYFPGTRDVVSGIADAVVRALGINNQNEESKVFDDQYISSGGQLYLLASGVYRFAADIRPALSAISAKRGAGQVLCCHPYDIGGLLILREAGGIITDLSGNEMNAPFDTDTKCGWLAYANRELRGLLEPVVLEELQKLKRESGEATG